MQNLLTELSELEAKADKEDEILLGGIQNIIEQYFALKIRSELSEIAEAINEVGLSTKLLLLEDDDTSTAVVIGFDTKNALTIYIDHVVTTIINDRLLSEGRLTEVENGEADGLGEL